MEIAKYGIVEHSKNHQDIYEFEAGNGRYVRIHCLLDEPGMFWCSAPGYLPIDTEFDQMSDCDPAAQY